VDGSGFIERVSTKTRSCAGEEKYNTTSRTFTHSKG